MFKVRVPRGCEVYPRGSGELIKCAQNASLNIVTKKDDIKMQHEKWIWEPSQGGQVNEKTLNLKPVDPVAYKMKDIWGYDQDEFPIEPFDIEVRITAPTVREGLNLFEQAVKEYMLEHFDGYTRHQYVERLEWSDEFSELKTCEIIMST